MIDPFLDVPSHYSQQLKLTIQQMMQHNPKRRMLPRQLLDSIAIKRWTNMLFKPHDKYYGQKLQLINSEGKQVINFFQMPTDVHLQDVLSTFNDFKTLESLFPASNYDSYEFKWVPKLNNPGHEDQIVELAGSNTQSERSPDVYQTSKYKPSDQDTFDSRFRNQQGVNLTNEMP